MTVKSRDVKTCAIKGRGVGGSISNNQYLHPCPASTITGRNGTQARTSPDAPFRWVTGVVTWAVVCGSTTTGNMQLYDMSYSSSGFLYFSGFYNTAQTIG
jgi:hypothetical protein